MENHKVTVIYGDYDKNRDIFDGKIESFGEINFGFHIQSLIEFMQSKYGDLEAVKYLNEANALETIGFILTTLGHVVFLNLIGHQGARLGILILPWTISENQRRSLQIMVKELKNFDFYILYDLKLVDGLVEGLEFECLYEDMPKFIENYVSNKEEITKKSAPYY